MDDNRVSPMEERALTNAIERAATVISINRDLDCNTVLANQLKKANIDPKFAKTASQAFNKRLTVLTFQKTADEHKADSFQLSDADTVYGLVADVEAPTIAKAASFFMCITGTQEVPSMEKAASAVSFDKRKLYEHRVSMETFQEHIESMMDKYAAALYDMQGLQKRLARAVDAEAEDVATIFKNAHYDFDFTTAVNLYGDKLKAVIGDKIDKSASFIPTSKFVIKPQKQIFEKVAKLIEDKEALDSITTFMGDYATALSEFCKSAAALSEEYQLKKVAADPQLPGPQGSQTNQSSLDYARQQLADLEQQLTQAAVDGTDSGVWQARSNAAADLLLGGLAAGTEGAIKGITDITGAGRAALNNARALYAAGNNVSISPGDLLDAAFLTKDRYRDRLLAWSDMSADPQLALYPAEQVFQATNKAMDMDTSMERPDQREVLRAQVAQLLAQNNRASTADIAALAETLKALSSARQNAAVAGDKAVSELSDKEAPEAPELEKIVGEYGDDLSGLHQLSEDAKKDYDKQIDALEKIRDDQNKSKSENIKDLRKSTETARGRVFNALQKDEDRATAAARHRDDMRQAHFDRANANRIADKTNASQERIAQTKNYGLFRFLKDVEEGKAKLPPGFRLNIGDTINTYNNPKPKDKDKDKDNQNPDKDRQEPPKDNDTDKKEEKNDK